jgi:hypothetical protein
MHETNLEHIARMSRMIEFLAANPDLPPAIISEQRIDFWPTHHGIDAAEVIRRYGSMEKVVESIHDTLFILRKQMDGFRVEFNFHRETVCTRVKVGQKVTPAKPAVVLPAEPEKVEDVYEWKCPESLLRPKDEADVISNATAEAMEAAANPPTSETRELPL